MYKHWARKDTGPDSFNAYPSILYFDTTHASSRHNDDSSKILNQKT